MEAGKISEWSSRRVWTEGSSDEATGVDDAVISDVAGPSQVELVFEAAFDPPLYAFHGMHEVMVLPPEHAATYPRLPQLPPRMQRFGIGRVEHTAPAA